MKKVSMMVRWLAMAQGYIHIFFSILTSWLPFSPLRFALLSDCDAAGARELAEGLRKEIAGCMVDLERGCARTTVSCGIAELAPEEDDARLFASAYEALYRAKRVGRNRVCIADS